MRLPYHAFLFAAIVILLLVPFPADAQYDQSSTTTKDPGCWNCIPQSFIESDCVAAPNNGYGEGIYCQESTHWYGQTCATSGGACYYTEVGGGGSPSGGGGGSGSCGYTGGFCPAECFDCGGMYY